MIENLIIIPYRNRKEHLNYFIKKSWPLIEENIANPFLLIVEQNQDNKLFNRGKLLNVGVDLYKDKANYIITHDVDINPNNESISLYNNKQSDIVRIYSAHSRSLGGIVKFKTDKFLEINGFPNNIWGWGIEDRALYYRAKIYNISLTHSTCDKNKLNFLSHKSNVHIYTGKKKVISELEDEVFKNYPLNKQIEHILQSGLNNIEYNVIEDNNIKDNIKIIKVNI